jgi:filamentous hemagglutinin family protein
MNKIHKVIWSPTHGRMVVVSELTRGSRGKKSGRRALAPALIICAAVATSAHADDVLPTGANIVSGAASVTTTGGSMKVDQTTDKLITDWQSFSIGEGNSVTFNQPGASSVALNRVVGQDPSKILGALSANGQVFLVNPNGVVFGRGAQVNAGSFVASTLALSNEDLLAGRYELSGDRGSILNEGTLKGAVVALIAPTVTNAGTIEGSTALAAGTNVALDFNGDGLLSVEVGGSTLATLVENRGLIQANGGVAILTAQGASSALAGVVSNSGVVQAGSIERRGGRIILEAQDGRVSSSGTLDVSSRDDRGGRIVATGDHVLIADGAHLNATGGRGGGEIYVGGGWQGSDPSIYQATETVVASGATLDASATGTGDGGTVVAWSDIHNSASVTRATGTFLARGGVTGGNGGRIETSGHSLETAGVRGSASAPAGEAGLWLFDPYNITISSSVNANGGFSTGTWTPSATNSNILNTNINALLDGGTNVTVTTGTSGGDIGDIVVNAPITKSAGADVTLTLRAANSIRVNEAITSTSGRMNILLDADNNNGSADGAGVVMVFNDIGTNGGDLSFGTGRTLSIGGVSTLVGGDVFIGGAGARTFSTGGGNVNVRGELILANTNGLTVDSGGGNIVFSGLLNSGNAYSYVDGPDGTGSWTWARTDAKNGTAGGSAVGDSYLVNMTSRLENSVAASAGNYRGAWIGAWRPDIAQRVWQWADGPESGVTFFNQNATNNGGTATPGYYQNFGSGEPNGCQTTPSSCDESVGQFYGTLGQWNDLKATTVFSPTQGNEYQVLGYLRETNLPESPLTVNAGAGSVTFSRAVGNAKRLASLDVTGSSISVAAGAGAAGRISASATSGNLSIAGAISSSDTSAAAIVLNAGSNNSAGDATGGNILIAGGTSITTGAGGRATLYTGSISGSTGLTNLIGSGSGRFRYNSDEIATNYTAALSSGAYAVYREQPLITAAAGGTMTYGQTPPVLNVNATGLQNGDALSAASANVSSAATRSSSGHLTAGTHVVNVSASSDVGYALNIVDGTLDVSRATITLSGLTAANRTYNGTADATLGTESAVFNGLVIGDDLSASGNTTFEDKHAGTAKTVNISGLSLTGADAGNYVLAGTTATTTADIYKAGITVSSADVVKTYDGTIAATSTAMVTAGQLYDTDSLSGGSFQFSDKNAGTNKTVHVAGVSVDDGNGGGNYEVTHADNVTSTINRASILVTGITALDKTYDATTAAALETSGAALSGMIGGDSVSLANATGAFSNKNAGVGKTVNVTGISLSGADAGNYVWADTLTTTATINKATISGIGGIRAIDKPYDGTTNATLDPIGAVFNGKLPGDTLTVSGSSGAFADPNPGVDKAVNISGLVLGGEDAANYVLAHETATTTAAIGQMTPPPLPPVTQPVLPPIATPGATPGESPADTAGNGPTGTEANAGGSTETNAAAGADTSDGTSPTGTRRETQLVTVAPADLTEASAGRTLAENKSRTALDAVLYGEAKAALIVYTLSREGVLTVEIPESVPWKDLGNEAALRKLASEKLGVEIGEIREVRVKTTKA